MPVTRRDTVRIAAGAALATALSSPARPQAGIDKLALWDNASGPHLRGAVMSQRRVYHAIDGREFLGPGPAGAPISAAALQGLADAGANLLVLSHAGLCAIDPPYQPDPAIIAHLDQLIGAAERAGLFVVIGFRSGPGRSAFTFHRGDEGSWFPASMMNDDVWRSAEAWDGWEAMWRLTARRYRNHPAIAGYLLMVEPNANQAAPGPDGGDLDVWQADRLAETVAGTRADWPALAQRLSRAIRAEDERTPILLSPDGYAHQSFESLLDLDAVPGQVLCVHDYAPRAYTHQSRGAGIDYAPGEGAISPPQAGRWMMGEFGAVRWAPRAGDFLRERISALEGLGAAWSVFRWDSGWRVYEDQENGFNPLYGSAIEDARLLDTDTAPMARALKAGWSRNRVRPQLPLRR